MTRAQIQEKIEDILDNSTFSFTSFDKDDKSLDQIEFVMALEEEFGFEIDQKSEECLDSLENAVDYIDGVLNTKITRDSETEKTQEEKPVQPQRSGKAALHPEVTEYVVCSACMNRDGLIVCGARHLDPIMRAVMDKTGGREAWLSCKQGFINQWGDFLTREYALSLAQKNNQMRRRCGGDEYELFSENLY